MNKLKRNFQIARRVISFSAVFWIGETVMFLILEGWHWQANTPAEKLCDNLVGIGLWVGVVYWVSAVNVLIKSVIKSDEGRWYL